MLRGEIRLVNPDPARADKAAKVRPAVVVSDDVLNATTASLGRGTVPLVGRLTAETGERLKVALRLHLGIQRSSRGGLVGESELLGFRRGDLGSHPCGSSRSWYWGCSGTC